MTVCGFRGGKKPVVGQQDYLSGRSKWETFGPYANGEVFYKGGKMDWWFKRNLLGFFELGTRGEILMSSNFSLRITIAFLEKESFFGWKTPSGFQHFKLKLLSKKKRKMNNWSSDAASNFARNWSTVRWKPFGRFRPRQGKRPWWQVVNLLGGFHVAVT